MALFLTDSNLSGAIRRVAGGRNLRCAVAFWGAGAARFFEEAGADLSKARIVCDVSMGGTSAEALTELGAPNNGRLRRQDGLHAKVYLSDNGLVVGSSNASTNGIGFAENGPVWLEAGSFFEKDSTAWNDAITWFGNVYRSAKQVDDAALVEAQRKFKPRAPFQDFSIRDGSILDLVRACPEQFGATGFVFCNQSTEQKHRDTERANKRESLPEEHRETFDSVPEDGIYYGWTKSEINRWPTLFVEFFLSSNKKLTVSGRQVLYFHPDRGSIFSKQNRTAVWKELPDNAPKAAKIVEVDKEIVIAVLGPIEGGLLFSSARDLSKRLIELNLK